MLFRSYFLDGNALIERIMQGTSLEWLGQHHAVKVYAISAKSPAARFDLRTWTGSGGESRYWFVDGTDSEHPTFGENSVD